jgi:hypothetical protein
MATCECDVSCRRRTKSQEAGEVVRLINAEVPRDADGTIRLPPG